MMLCLECQKIVLIEAPRYGGETAFRKYPSISNVKCMSEREDCAFCSFIWQVTLEETARDSTSKLKRLLDLEWSTGNPIHVSCFYHGRSSHSITVEYQGGEDDDSAGIFIGGGLDGLYAETSRVEIASPNMIIQL